MPRNSSINQTASAAFSRARGITSGKLVNAVGGLFLRIKGQNCALAERRYNSFTVVKAGAWPCLSGKRANPVKSFRKTVEGFRRSVCF